MSHFIIWSKHLIAPTFSRFVIHQHKTGRSHYDLRIIQKGILRSWSLLKQPPGRTGERRLAVERENIPVESINNKEFEEEAFGQGRVIVWDEGGVEIKVMSSSKLELRLMGCKVTGTYELRKMIWYPGNRWLLTKLADHADISRPTEPWGESNLP
jgi:DNA ligase D-like protein (predicted 3'-phosphoesterase)